MGKEGQKDERQGAGDGEPEADMEGAKTASIAEILEQSPRKNDI